MLEPLALLSLFSLTIISAFVYFAAKKFKIPYTILLVFIGLLIVPIVNIPFLSSGLGFLDDLQLTPELLFFVFLPILIFESAYNINIRKMVESSWSVVSLAVVGLIFSTLIISVGIYYIMPLVGLEIPFIVALLFGAIISSTDPVAVLALFKEYGAPKRLSLIFEGESLFNDGTAVALFLVFLAIAESGFDGSSTILEGLLMFLSMVGFGVLFGIIMATIFSRFLRFTRSNEFVAITLLLVSAHFVFILSELINEHGLFGLPIHISPIIATTISSLFLGNYSRHILSPKSDDYTDKLLSHLAFIANSLVFILAGVLFASANIPLNILILPIIVTILIVAVARALSVYGVLLPLNYFKKDMMPNSWRKLIAWGSLRGALAIIVVLLIPQDFTIAGWQYDYSVREFILALTIGCVLATLFIKGLTIAPLMKKLKINRVSILEQAYYSDLGIYYLQTEKFRFSEQKIRGFIIDKEYKNISLKLNKKIRETLKERDLLIEQYGLQPFEQSLRLTAINIEDHYLKELYVHQEVSENIYRTLKRKLEHQKEKIEIAQQDQIDPSESLDRKDIFDRLVLFMNSFLSRSPKETKTEEKLQYYRAQQIISRKALKILSQLQNQYDLPVYNEEAYKKVIATYENFKKTSGEKLAKLLNTHSKKLNPYLAELSYNSLNVSGEKALMFFNDKGIASEHTQSIIKSKYAINN